MHEEPAIGAETDKQAANDSTCDLEVQAEAVKHERAAGDTAAVHAEPGAGSDARTETGILWTLLQEMQEQMQRLHASFDDKIRYDAGREAVIDRLHAELQEYKADLLLKVLKPLVQDLLDLHDDVGKRAAACRGSEASEALLGIHGEFQSDIEVILTRNGFEPFSAPEELFDPKRQRVQRPVATTDAGLDRRIAERVRKGFSYEGRVARPEVVNVYVYTPPASS